MAFWFFYTFTAPKLQPHTSLYDATQSGQGCRHSSGEHEEETTRNGASELRCNIGSFRYGQQCNVRNGKTFIMIDEALLCMKLFFFVFHFIRNRWWDIPVIPWHSKSWGNARFTWLHPSARTAVKLGFLDSQQGKQWDVFMAQ